MATLHNHLREVIDGSGLTKKELSRRIGANDGYVSNMLNRTDQDPAFSLVLRICAVLEVDPWDLLAPSATIDRQKSEEAEMRASRLLDIAIEKAQRSLLSSAAPTVEDVLGWWFRNEGTMNTASRIADFVDLYRPPDATRTRPEVVRVGTHSLATEELKAPDKDQLQTVINNLDVPLAARVYESHAAAHRDGQPIIATEDVEIEHPGTTRRLKLNYVRVILPVRGWDGEPGTITFAKRLPATQGRNTW